MELRAQQQRQRVGGVDLHLVELGDDVADREAGDGGRSAVGGVRGGRGGGQQREVSAGGAGGGGAVRARGGAAPPPGAPATATKTWPATTADGSPNASVGRPLTWSIFTTATAVSQS